MPMAAFPTAYYAALASLCPLVWVVLVFQAKINQDPWPDYIRRDILGVLTVLAIQLVGLVGLPLMEYGVLLTLHDQQPRWWVEQNVMRFLLVSVGSIVVPVLWRIVGQLISDKYRPGVEQIGAGVIVAAAYFYLAGAP